MKKLATTALAALVLFSFGSAFAQTSQSHGVEVKVPGIMMIRLVNATSNAPVANPTAVVFDLTSVAAAAFDPAGTYGPTNAGTANWDDVIVFSNQGAWQVTVALTNAVGALDWSQVSVPGLFALTEGAQVATSASRTTGFESLGFGHADFDLTLDGTEDSGDSSVTVTYTIAAL